MKAFIAFLAIVAVASAGYVSPYSTLLRTPSLDSAVVKSDQIGGNFAYSATTGHAYAAVAPVISHVTSPIAVSYQAHAPVYSTYAAPGLLRSGLYHSHGGYPYGYSYGAWTPSYGSVVVA